MKHNRSISAPGVCPVFPTPAECPNEVENFCTDDSSCPSELKCCNTGCELDCVGKFDHNCIRKWSSDMLHGAKCNLD